MTFCLHSDVLILGLFMHKAVTAFRCRGQLLIQMLRADTTTGTADMLITLRSLTSHPPCCPLQMIRSSSFESLSTDSIPPSPTAAQLPSRVTFQAPENRALPSLPYASSSLLQPSHSSSPDMSADLQTRELAFAAKQYSSCCTASPDDSNYDTLYNHGLVLQELAVRLVPGSPDQVVMLQEVRGALCGDI